MNLDLCTIDWTAIGSIATVIAMIIAYRTIYISVKQNLSSTYKCNFLGADNKQ